MNEDRLTIRTSDDDICFAVEDDPEGAYDITDLVRDGYEDIAISVANRLAAYEDLGTPAELSELVKAMEEGRILPEGYGRLMSSDNKALYVWYPEGKFAAVIKRSYIVPSGERRCDHE